ncbi:MAG TPA: foldase [Firmicutes bacterium]|nr:foldase [Bacillota bacterium]
MDPKSNREFKLKPHYLVAIILVIVIIGAAALVIYFSQRGEVVATVNGENIYKDQLYEAMFSAGGREMLDQLISKQLIIQEGRRQGIKVSDEEVEQELSNFTEELGAYFDQFLEQSGMTREQIKEELRVNLYAKKMATEQIKITDEDLKTYFKENQESFNIPEQIEARHILVETREEADEILSQLNEGKDFSALAKEHSLDTNNKETGGNLGLFSKGVMEPAFEEAAFSLPKGGISQPVETGHGFHIIEVLDHQPAREVSFEEVKEEVRQSKLEEMLPSQVQSILTSLWDSAEIDYR